MSKKHNIDITLLKELGDQAATHYQQAERKIAVTKERIEQNREGKYPLLEIGEDEHRKALRIAREQTDSDLNALERVNGVPDFQDVSIIHRLVRSSDAVCRILIGSENGRSGYGTGFLVAPGVLMTNNHVLDNSSAAARSMAQFSYEIDIHGQARSGVNFKLLPNRLFITSPYRKKASDPLSGLDFTLVALEEQAADGTPLHKFGHIRLDGGLGKIIDGENCVVIQHPKGDYKKIVLKDIRMITVTEDVLIYESDTHPGSSGSPVLGLGTGELVALHHSGVPRTDKQGNWLHRDGRIWRPSDGDQAVDWIGNEGIRVSRIVDAIRRSQVPNEMDKLRQLVLDGTIGGHRPIDIPGERVTPVVPEQMPDTIIRNAPATSPQSMTNTTILGFELLLSSDERMRAKFMEQAEHLIPGLTSILPVFPGSTEPYSARIHYIEVASSAAPWDLAAAIESLPFVDACTPDLPMLTDAKPSADSLGHQTLPTEGAIGELIYNDGTGKPNEDEFVKKWTGTKFIDDLLKEDPSRKGMRKWNWKMVNWKGLASVSASVRTELAKLRFVQLDTGYSDHSKVMNSFDLDKDRDFIDGGDDARDTMSAWGFKFPGHGTRTASITVGGRLIGNSEFDGNPGLLSDPDEIPAVKLIPYRIARTVVLIARGKEMVDAAQHACDTGTDVMFMCMGSYPRPMMAAMARKAYDQGVIWVCAAGNQVKIVVAPAMYPGTIAVAAINPGRQPWKGSSRGRAVDVAAPGEDVYVPIWTKDRKEIMVYGNGTSYATPHVASAAMLWKATHAATLRTMYPAPWQIVEAFRYCVKKCVSKHEQETPAGYYGAGILDIGKLLKVPLPKAGSLYHAYTGKAMDTPLDLSERELLHTLWTGERSAELQGVHESVFQAPLSARAQLALEALSPVSSSDLLESGMDSFRDRSAVLEDLFERSSNS